MSGKGAETMKKLFRVLGLSLLMVFLCCPSAVLATDVVWQLQWQDDGTLREEVQIRGGDVTDPDSTWKSSHQGDSLLLQRETAGWSSYQKLPDRLPLQVREINFVFGQITYLSIDPPPSEGLWAQLKGLSGFRLTIGAPGYFKISETNKWEEIQYSWDCPDTTTWLPTGSLARIVTVDGFLSAVAIVLLAMLIIGIKFLNRLKKADEIIAEEFALTPPEESPPDQAETQ